MSKNVVGTVILVALIVVGFLFMPVYYMAQVDMARSQEQLLSEVQLFIDKVSDTKEITNKDLEDFTLAMASTSIPVKFEVTREVRQVNPDPLSTTNPKKTITNWIPTDDISKFHTGDIVTVEIEQVGENLYQSFARRVLGMYTPTVEFRLSRMVR